MVEIPKGSRNKHERDHDLKLAGRWQDRWAILAEDRPRRGVGSGRTT